MRSSNYYVYSEPDENDPVTMCLPLQGQRASPMAVGDISIMPKVDSASYTVIAVYDMESGSFHLSQSVLGGGSMVYMNHDTYTLPATHTTTCGEPYTDGIYTVVEYNNTVNTQFTRSVSKITASTSRRLVLFRLPEQPSFPWTNMTAPAGISTKTVNSYKNLYG